MAELVDATDSKSVVRKNVGVQVPLSAPKSVAETPVRVSAKETWFLCKKRTGTAGNYTIREPASNILTLVLAASNKLH